MLRRKIGNPLLVGLSGKLINMIDFMLEMQWVSKFSRKWFTYDNESNSMFDLLNIYTKNPLACKKVPIKNQIP